MKQIGKAIAIVIMKNELYISETNITNIIFGNYKWGIFTSLNGEEGYFYSQGER